MASSKANKSAASRRLAAKHWVEAAIRRMSRLGVHGVEVVRLAADLKVSKGSFYWHFRNRAALLDGVLERWRQVTLDFNQLLESSEPDPESRMRRLMHLPEAASSRTAQNLDFEMAIRSWARHSARPRATVQEVDQLREALQLRIFNELGVRGRHAIALSRILGAVCARLWQDTMDAAVRRDLIDTAYRLLMEAARGNQGGPEPQTRRR
jgi:AcrR family transcriptional regulator